jgi:hypothetical protein
MGKNRCQIPLASMPKKRFEVILRTWLVIASVPFDKECFILLL